MSDFIITLKDKTSFPCISVFGENQFCAGSMRDCLTFDFDPMEVDVAKVISAMQNEDITSEIVIGKKGGNSFVYEDYIVFDSAKVYDKEVEKETSTKSQVLQRTLAIKLGRLSYSEKLEKERAEQLDNISEVIADILGGAL